VVPECPSGLIDREARRLSVAGLDYLSGSSIGFGWNVQSMPVECGFFGKRVMHIKLNIVASL